MEVEAVEVGSILTRAGGFLREVCSHSLQAYRGCPLGRSLCGVGCYVQHMTYLTRGRVWGSFLEVRTNAAEVYRRDYVREARWARSRRGGFAIFLSSASEPFPPAERRWAATRSVLEAMRELPPDRLIVQTHSPLVLDVLPLLQELRQVLELRVHVSVESDRDRLPGLPPPASPVEARLQAATRLSEAGFFVVVTVSPLLPIADPDAFFARIAGCASAVVIDHYVEGDGTPDGRRTARTRLPQAMAALDPDSLSLDYRDRMVAVARRHLPGRVGVNVDGFAGRYLGASET